MSKITKATFKSFIKKNSETLLIKCVSSFDGMTDCVEYNSKAAFKPIVKTDSHQEHTLGINGIWLVGDSRDYFKDFSEDGFKGIEVYNSCGSFILAVPA